MSSLAPISAQTLADQAFQKITEAIMRRELLPGQRISEALLARRLGISRGPLREAIRRLEGCKLVTRAPRVGVRVVEMSYRDLEECFVMREALEGMACRLAATHMTGEELAELDTVLERHARSDELRAGASYYQNVGDFDFHFLIIRGSRNSKLIEFLCDDLYYVTRIYRYRSSTAPGRARVAYEEHRAIAAAVRAHNPDLAETLMRQHIAHARDALRQGYAEAPAPPSAAAVVGATVTSLSPRATPDATP